MSNDATNETLPGENPLPAEIWERTPPESRAVMDDLARRILAAREEIAALNRQVEDILAKRARAMKLK